MARRKATNAQTAIQPDSAQDEAQAAETAQDTQSDAVAPPDAPAAQEQPAGEPRKQWTSKLPDPFGRHSINIGDGRRLRLNRSGRWHQMQIQFVATQEGVDPKPKKEDGDTQWLRERGWQWHGDPDTRAWTVQLLAPEEKELPSEDKARRRAAADRRAEDDFIELAQRIRERNGLPPVSVFAAGKQGMSPG